MATIRTIFSFKDDVSPGLKRMQNEISSTSGKLSRLSSIMLGVNAAIGILSTAANQFRRLTGSVNQCVQAYQYQSEQETKLATIMRQRMGATEEEIQSIKDFASAQQQVGIYGDELILQGAQELASFVSQREAIETLIPAMNNLIAQQYGYSASGQNFQMTADMMGKVLSGQTGALSRMGYVFSEEEKQMLKTGNEMQRAATLAKIITDNVGDMNRALKGTSAGAIQDTTNALGDMYERVGKTLQQIQGAFKQIKSSVMLYFEKPIINAIDWIQKNMGSLIATMIRVATVAAVVGSVMAAAWAAANWPLLAVIASVITLTRILFDITAGANAAAEAMNGFGNQCAQAGNTFGMVVGFMAGLVGGLMNIIYNVVATVYNALIYVSEFILNVFTHPINAIARLFIDLSNTIIQVLSTLAGAVDWVFNTSMSASLNEASRQLEDFKEENFGNVNYKYQKLELKDVQGILGATMAGGQIGGDLGGIIDKKFSTQEFQAAQQQFPDFKFDGNGNLAVSDKNLIDIADDYWELLSKRATERFNLQFSQVTPAINISNITVNREADEDRLVSKIRTALDEAVPANLREVVP